MKRAVALAVLFLAAYGVVQALAQNAYTKDGNTCDLNDNTRLSALCPNGFGLPTYGSQADMIARNPNIASMIVDAAKEYGVDPKLALAVSGHEGAMSACAGSFSGVQGPMQLTISTGQLFGMNRGILSQNIKGGMAALADAIKRCGGDSDIRCLANIYNGSTEAQRQNWTRDVTARLGQMNANPSLTPGGCDEQNATASCGPGDFNIGNGKVASATAPPPPRATDILVADGEV